MRAAERFLRLIRIRATDFCIAHLMRSTAEHRCLGYGTACACACGGIFLYASRHRALEPWLSGFSGAEAKDQLSRTCSTIRLSHGGGPVRNSSPCFFAPFADLTGRLGRAAA